MQLTIHTDGGAKDNGSENSIGSFGVCARWKKDDLLTERVTAVQRIDSETNNQMELRAVILALRLAISQNNASNVNIITDSSYVLNGITKWIDGWKSNNWIKPDKKAVKNKNLWMTLDELNTEANKKFDLKYTKVKGHDGIFENEHIDSVCTWGMKNLDPNEFRKEITSEDKFSFYGEEL